MEAADVLVEYGYQAGDVLDYDRGMTLEEYIAAVGIVQNRAIRARKERIIEMATAISSIFNPELLKETFQRLDNAVALVSERLNAPKRDTSVRSDTTRQAENERSMKELQKLSGFMKKA